MRKILSIQNRITLIVLLFGLVMIVLNQLRNQKWLVERRLDRLEQDAADTGSRLSGLLQHLARQQQERAAELEMAYVSLSADVELGVVCDMQGRVSCSTQLQWRGMNVQETPLADEWPRVKHALETMDAVLVWSADKKNLVTAFPFYETYDSAYRNAVLIRYDSTLALQQVRDEAWDESLRQAGVLLALSLLLWFALDELVVRRVRLLVENLRATAIRGAPPKVLGGADELTLISLEFARTVRQLHETEKLVLNAAEQERRKIGRDLHDDLCQRISATKMKTEVIQGLLPEKTDQAAELVSEVVEELAESTVIARSMARGLAPVGLVQHGLNDALEDVARFARKSYEVQCSIDCADLHEHLTASAQELLFRVAQELVVNACKHSKPETMSLTVHVESGQVVLLVVHDGAPFHAGETTAKHGMGLHIMNQRLRALSATLERSNQHDSRDFSIATVRIPSDTSRAA